MRTTFDPTKRLRTLQDRGLDFEDASLVFEGTTIEVEDIRKTTVSAASSAMACSPVASSYWAMRPGAIRATFLACERPTTVKKPVSRRTLKSDLPKVDAHTIRAHEYRELPQLSEQALSRAVVNKGGRPRSTNPRKLLSIRLPVDVIERWKATGPGWQTRIAERLSKVR